MKKRIFCLFLVLTLLAACLGACGEDEAPATTLPSGEQGEAVENPYATRLENEFLVKDGKSDYVLVLTDSPMNYESFAAEEFNTFLSMSNGCTLDTVSESTLTDGTPFISIGNTKQLQAAFPDVDLAALHSKQSSYFIASKDGNIYVASGDGYRGYGSLYAIYDLLHDLIDYTYYCDTEIYVNNSADVNLYAYEQHIVEATIDARTHSTAYIYCNSLHNTRLRYINFSNGVEWNRMTIGHSQLMVYLHPTDSDDSGVPYGESHPEWFVDPYEDAPQINSNQLCWTAHGDEASLAEMQTVVADRLITFLQMDPEANFFMFGQHDNSIACTCYGCLDALREWGGNQSGLQINFFNGVLDQVNAWLETNAPNREVSFVVYAYRFTQSPPVSQDADGNYVAYSDKVIPDARMRIFYAPVEMNYAFPFDSPNNSLAAHDLAGWSALCTEGQLFTYLYDLNVNNYFINFFNFGTVQSMIQELSDAGVTYLLNQGASDQVNVTGFQALRAYAMSNLMWNADLNYQELAADFIVHYYKDAAEPMQELFDMICDRNAYYGCAEDLGLATINSFPTSNKLYPKAFVEKMDQQIQLAMDAIAHYQDTDPELYQALSDRIMMENLSVLYLKAVVYGDSYSNEELAEMRETWNYYINYFGITKGGEGSNLPQF